MASGPRSEGEVVSCVGPDRELFKQRSRHGGEPLGVSRDGKKSVWLKKQQGTEWDEMSAKKAWGKMERRQGPEHTGRCKTG